MAAGVAKHPGPMQIWGGFEERLFRETQLHTSKRLPDLGQLPANQRVGSRTKKSEMKGTFSEAETILGPHPTDLKAANTGAREAARQDDALPSSRQAFRANHKRPSNALFKETP